MNFQNYNELMAKERRIYGKGSIAAAPPWLPISMTEAPAPISCTHGCMH